MALIIETHLVCDRCGKSEFGKDNPQRTGSQQREIAQNNGWGKSRSFDVCPNCIYKNGRGNIAVKKLSLCPPTP
jgi:predicted nucleic-acid-binding Zn-ribbon protein